MNDRELLELAAKAAGYDVGAVDFCDPIGRKYSYGLGLWIEPKSGHWWNPLAHDGDALRLAVKLGLEYRINANNILVRGAFVRFPFEDDPLPHLRRAIVRAAAEVGKAMP